MHTHGYFFYFGTFFLMLKKYNSVTKHARNYRTTRLGRRSYVAITRKIKKK